jgi:hypothetical protein
MGTHARFNGRWKQRPQMRLGDFENESPTGIIQNHNFIQDTKNATKRGGVLHQSRSGMVGVPRIGGRMPGRSMNFAKEP